MINLGYLTRGELHDMKREIQRIKEIIKSKGEGRGGKGKGRGWEGRGEIGCFRGG